MMDRLERHSRLREYLERLSDDRLAELLAAATPIHVGVGGRSALVNVESVPVFAKWVPLTRLELRPESRRSTANIFGLPLFCHYGLGSPGFGAWRELEGNLQATEWATTGACEHFALLHHWRVLPRSGVGPMTAEQRAALERDVHAWEGTSAVRARLEAIHDAPAALVLLSEYVPLTLLGWLQAQFANGPEATTLALRFVEANLGPVIRFMNSRGLAHFDAHFENIMTDGHRLYFCDFGLALSAKFTLSNEEVAFLAGHRSYDSGRSAVGFLHSIAAHFLGPGELDWKERIALHRRQPTSSLPPDAAGALDKYLPAVLAFLEFSRALQTVSKQSRYPDEQIRLLVRGND